MLQKKILKLWSMWTFWVVCNAISSAAQHTSNSNDPCGKPPTTTTNEKPPTPTALSLCQEFRAIRDLAGQSTIQTLIQTHWTTDSRFRKAVNFMLSPEFNATLQIIDTSVSYQQSLKQFSDAGVSTTDIDSVTKIFQCVLTPLLPTTRSAGSDVGIEQRSLDTMSLEIFSPISKKQLTNLLQSHLANNEQFAKFYGIVRDSGFRAGVTKAWTNRDISRALKKLRHNQIDLIKLVEYSLNLFSSGPEI